MGKLIFLSFFISTSLFAAIKRPSGAVFLNQKAYSIEFSEYMFQTTSYYDHQGHENAMPTDTSFNLSDTELKINYGIDKNLEVNLMGRIRRLVSTGLNGTTPLNLNKLGIESAQIGIKYQFPEVDNIFYALGAHFRQTLYTNPKFESPSTAPKDVIVLGDDGSEFSVDFYTTFLYPKNRMDFNLSYVSPPNHLSGEIDYKFEAYHQFDKFGIIAGVDGIFSMKKDPYDLDPALKPQMSTGSTSLFNSINRSKNEAYIGSLYDFSKVTFEARGGMVLSGSSIDKGYFALLNLNFNSSGVTKETVKIESFKEYHIDGSVLKVSARGNLIKIDQGLSTDVEKGTQFDIYQTDYFGGNVLVASGYVIEVGADSSVVKLVKKYSEIEIKPGFAARGK